MSSGWGLWLGILQERVWLARDWPGLWAALPITCDPFRWQLHRNELIKWKPRLILSGNLPVVQPLST